MTNATDSFFGGSPQLGWAVTKPDGSWESDQTKFNVVRGGRIVGEPVIQNQIEMGTGKVRTWDDGQPQKQLVVPLQCDGSGKPTGPNGNVLPVLDERVSPTDNGRRSLYVKGKEMKNAIREAYQRAGADGIRVGGELYIIWTGNRPSKIKGGPPARTYAALYIPPAVGMPGTEGGNPFGGQQQPAQQAPQQPAAPPAAQNPWEQAPAAPAPAQPPAAAPPAAANPWGAPASPPQQAPTPNPFG